MRLFHQLDLNLLRVFKVLYEEQHTGRTAERLNVAQPSVSRSLKRLRDHCEDPLFIKSKDGLTPTPLATRMAAVIPGILDQLASSFLGFDTFDIARRKEPVRIAVNSFLALSLPAKLHLLLENVAPNVLIEVDIWDETTPSKLSKGELDFAINYFPLTLPKDVISLPLERDTFQILAREDHPLQSLENVLLSDLTHYPLATVIVKGWNEKTTLASRIFALHNLKAQMGYRSQIFSSVAEVTAESDAVFPCSSLVSKGLFPNLKQIKLDKQQGFVQEDVHFYFHQRLKNDPFIDYIYEKTKSITSELVLQNSTANQT